MLNGSRHLNSLVGQSFVTDIDGTAPLTKIFVVGVYSLLWSGCRGHGLGWWESSVECDGQEPHEITKGTISGPSIFALRRDRRQ